MSLAAAASARTKIGWGRDDYMTGSLAGAHSIATGMSPDRLVKTSTWPPLDTFWPNVAFFVSTHRPPSPCQVEVSSLNRSRDTKGVPEFQQWVTWPHMSTFVLTAISLRAKFEVSNFICSRNIRRRVVPKFQKWVTWPTRDTFWPNFAFSLELTAVRLHHKFEVSSSNRSRDIQGVPKLQKWVTSPSSDPFLLIFASFSLELTAIRLLAKVWSL